MYWLPRQYWRDFIQLATIYSSAQVFHEIAIPTMFHIIDRTYRQHSSMSIIYRWSDCWGGCCLVAQRPGDILSKRCGHKIDYLNWELARLHYDRLKEEAKLLATPIPKKITPGEHWVKLRAGIVDSNTTAHKQPIGKRGLLNYAMA